MHWRVLTVAVSDVQIEQFAELMGNYSTIEKVAWKQCACTLASYKEEDFVKTLSPEERLDWFMRAEARPCHLPFPPPGR